MNQRPDSKRAKMHGRCLRRRLDDDDSLLGNSVDASHQKRYARSGLHSAERQQERGPFGKEEPTTGAGRISRCAPAHHPLLGVRTLPNWNSSFHKRNEGAEHDAAQHSSGLRRQEYVIKK